MAIAKSSTQPSMYIKINDNSAIFGVAAREVQTPDIINEDGTTTPQPPTIVPATTKIVVGFTRFKSYAERIAAETDEMIWNKDDSREVEGFPELPEGWQPNNPTTREIEKLKTIAYLALKTLPEFAEWVDYQ